MKLTKLVAAAALAAAVCVAEAPSASATQLLPTEAATTNPAGVVVPMVWAVAFFLCTGLTWGKMQVDAQKLHHQLTGADAFRGAGRCLLPPIGLARLVQGR